MYFNEGSTSGITSSTDGTLNYSSWGQSSFPAVANYTSRWGGWNPLTDFYNENGFNFGRWRRNYQYINNPDVRILILKNKHLQMRNTSTNTLLFNTETNTYNDGFSTTFSTTTSTYQMLVEKYDGTTYHYVFATSDSRSGNVRSMCYSMGLSDYSWAVNSYQVIFLSGGSGTAQAEYAIEDNLDADNNVVGALLQGEIKIQTDTTNQNADVTTTLQIPYDTTAPTGTGKEGEIQIVKENSSMSLYVSDGTSYQNISSGGTSSSSQNISSGIIKEYISEICNGQSITTKYGDTLQIANITTAQYFNTASYQTITGSSITYRPPTDTIKVIYKFSFLVADNNRGIGHLRFYIDGNEVTTVRRAISHHDNYETIFDYEIPINITGGTDNYANAILSSWNSLRTLEIKGRDYNSTYSWYAHRTEWWDGASISQICRPIINLIAI
jgi:hypothetical protein